MWNRFLCKRNPELLEDITRVLLGDGFHPLLDLKEEKGETRDYSNIEVNTRRDVYELSLNRNEVIQLLQRLPLKHNHKKRQRQLLLEALKEYRGRIEPLQRS